MSGERQQPQQQTTPKTPFNAGDEVSVAEKTAQAKKRAHRVAAGLTHVMANADARLWLHSLLEAAGPFQETFTGNSETFYRCGRQAWAKVLTAQLLDQHLEQYILMMREAKNG